VAVVIAHRPSAVSAVDHILILNEGRVQALGPRAEIFRQPAPHPRPEEQPAHAQDTQIVRAPEGRSVRKPASKRRNGFGQTRTVS
jgi:ABC-type sulfate/molybdate transport systems ATPase subunit